MVALLMLLAGAAAVPGDQAVERQHVLTIEAQEIDNGILSEITWDSGALLLQGVVANPDGSLSGRYVVIPAKATKLEKRQDQTGPSLDYWNRKSKRVSPTGLGTISTGADSKMPIYGIASLERRMLDAQDMGGMQQKVIIRLNRLILHERDGAVEPYDGEIWSWSPAELNRIAYVDGKGDLWIASADGRNAERILRGKFTLPAWSDDGKAIAVAERKDGGRRWDISVVILPEHLRTAR